MIRVRSLRFWTTVIVVALAAPTIPMGFSLMQYGLASAFADASNADTRLRPFADDSPWAALAQKGLLSFRVPTDPTKAAADVSALLSATPMNGGAWLDLAIARRASGASTENVAAALAMSNVTAPNEARFMAGRAEFALPFWAALPRDARNSLIADLISGWDAVDAPHRERLSKTLHLAPEDAGEQVRAALLTNGAAGAAVANALFPPPPKPDAPAVPDR